MNNYPLYHYDIEQRSDEWFDIRAGKITASSIPKLFMAPSTKTFQSEIVRIATERITGQYESSNDKSSYWMDRGNELEPEARVAFEDQYFQKVKQVGFVSHSETTGCSPDGLIGDDGLIQIKCPKGTTVVNKILEMEQKSKSLSNEDLIAKKHFLSTIEIGYRRQMQAEMYLTNRKYNIYWGFHPYVKSIYYKMFREEQIISEIILKIIYANKLIEQTVDIINKFNN